MKPSASLVERGRASLESPRGTSLVGLVWTLLPRRNMPTPLRMLVLGSTLLAPMVHGRQVPTDVPWLAAGVFQALLFMVVASSVMVPATPSLAERLWPMTVRRVFILHIAQRLLLGLGPFVLMSLLVWGIGWVRVGSVHAGPIAARQSDASAQPWLEVVAVLVLACLLPFLSAQSPIADGGEKALRERRAFVLSIGWLLVALHWLGEPWRLFAPTAAVLLMLPLVWRQWTRAYEPAVSASLEYDSSESRPMKMRGAYGLPSRPASTSGPGLLDTWRLVWALSPSRWLLVVLSAMYPPLIAYGAYTGSRNAISLFAAMVPAMIFLSQSQALSVLPVHPWRRLQLTVVMFPLAATMAVVCGLALRSVYRPPITHTREAPFGEAFAGDWDNPSRVQLAYWRWSSADTPPAVVAPWGEQVRPYAARILVWWLYNPFTVRKGTSEAFQRWQWQRLTTTVYGVPVAKEVLAKRTRDRPPMRSEQWPILTLRTAFSFALLLIVTLGCWHGRVNRFTWRAALGTAGFCLLMLLPMLGDFLSGGLGLGLVSGVVDQLLMALVAQLPTDPLALVTTVGAISLLPVLAALALLYRASLQPMLEFTPRQTPGWGSSRG